MDTLGDDMFENDPADALFNQPWGDDADDLSGQLPLGVASRGSEPLLLPSPSVLSSSVAQQQHGLAGPAGWQQQLGSNAAGGITPFPPRKPSIGSLLDFSDVPNSSSQPLTISPGGLSLADAGIDSFGGQPSPASAGDAWLKGPQAPWSHNQQQQHQQSLADSNVLRQHYREAHSQQQYLQQQQVPMSVGAATAWQQQQPEHRPGMVATAASVPGLVPIASTTTAATATSEAPLGQQQQQQDSRSQDKQDAQAMQQQQQQQGKPKRQPKPSKRTQQSEAAGGPNGTGLQQSNGVHSTPHRSSMQQQQQSLPSQGGLGPGAGQPDWQKQQQAAGMGEEQQQHQLPRSNSFGAAHVPPSGQLPPLPPDAAAASAQGAAKKKSNKKKEPAAGAAGGGSTGGGGGGSSSTAAVVAPSLWKAPPLPREARIPREPGVEYEEVLPPGMPSSSIRPLPVPADLFQLSDLSGILNLDTWQNVLDEQDRAALRALLPDGGAGFDENANGQLDKLLTGKDNFCFGNPTDLFWQDLQSGASVPRARRHQEMVIQLKQQMAAMQLREYHNSQVSRFIDMQRLWSAKLPASASTAERLALWKAAQAGEVDIPDSPRTAAQAQADTAEPITAGAKGRGASKAAVAAAAAAAVAAAASGDSGGEGAIAERAAVTAPVAPVTMPAQLPTPAAALPAPARAAAASKRGSADGSNGGVVRGAGKRDVFVYEGPVDFSKHLTKRQQAAAAAAVAANAADSGVQQALQAGQVAAAGGGIHMKHTATAAQQQQQQWQPQQWQQQQQQQQQWQQMQQQQQQWQQMQFVQQQQQQVPSSARPVGTAAGGQAAAMTAATAGLVMPPGQFKMTLGQLPLANQLQQFQQYQAAASAAAARQGAAPGMQWQQQPQQWQRPG